MTIKLFHQVIYYTVLLPVCLGLIITGLLGTDCRFKSYYHTANDFLNNVKGEYQDIGT